VTRAASEYAWVWLPADRAMAVRLPLLLTGNPCSSPAPMLAAPSARNSWLASTCSSRWANERAVSTSSVKATASTVSAGRTRLARSPRLSWGSPGAGSPAGIGPTTAIPCCSRPPAHTTPADTRTAISGPGTRGQRARTTNRKASTSAASRTVAGWAWPMPLAKDASSATNVRPVTGTPVSLASCPLIMITATPAR